MRGLGLGGPDSAWAVDEQEDISDQRPGHGHCLLCGLLLGCVLFVHVALCRQNSSMPPTPGPVHCLQCAQPAVTDDNNVANQQTTPPPVPPNHATDARPDQNLTKSKANNSPGQSLSRRRGRGPFCIRLSSTATRRTPPTLPRLRPLPRPEREPEAKAKAEAIRRFAARVAARDHRRVAKLEREQQRAASRANIAAGRRGDGRQPRRSSRRIDYCVLGRSGGKVGKG